MAPTGHSFATSPCGHMPTASARSWTDTECPSSWLATARGESLWVCLLSDDAKILVGQGFSRCQLATEGRQSWGYRQFGWISRLLKAVRYLIGAGSEGGGGRGMSDPCRRGCALRPAERRPASG